MSLHSVDQPKDEIDIIFLHLRYPKKCPDCGLPLSLDKELTIQKTETNYQMFLLSCNNCKLIEIMQKMMPLQEIQPQAIQPKHPIKGHTKHFYTDGKSKLFRTIEDFQNDNPLIIY